MFRTRSQARAALTLAAAAMVAGFVGCEKGDDGSRSPVDITPSTYSFVVGGASNVTLEADGGLPPYAWSVSDATLGSVAGSGSLAVYTRLARSGQNIVTATDSNGYTGQAVMSQDYEATTLTIDPSEETLTAGGDSNIVFEVTGGSEPYTWSVSDSSLGSIDGAGSYAIYTRLNQPGANLVKVRDSNGSSATATVTQQGGGASLTNLSISPSTYTMADDETNKIFQASGGQKPYTWTLYSSALGSLSSSESYAIYARAGAAGGNFITVTDASGASATAAIVQK